MITITITETGPPDRPWSLQWRTHNMPTPSFWYFTTQEKAEQEKRDLEYAHARTKDGR